MNSTSAFVPYSSFAVQVIVVLPDFKAVTLPVESTVATVASEDFQLTVESFGVGLVGLIDADNCFDSPTHAEVVPESVISVTCCLTVKVIVAAAPWLSLALAVIVTVPLAIPLTLPEVVTVATFVLLEDQSILELYGATSCSIVAVN